MKEIEIKNKFTGKTHLYKQITDIKDIYSMFSSIGDEAVDDIREIQKDRNNYNPDCIDKLIGLHKYLNDNIPTSEIQLGKYGKLVINDCPHLDTSRSNLETLKMEGMIKLFNKYGEIWINRLGGYCSPMKDYEII